MLSVDSVFSSSSFQDSQPVKIKEEGLEELIENVSSDSGQFRDDPDQDDGDDPDYQVKSINASII